MNIAEGKGRYHTKVYIQFLYQARGSLYETIVLIKMSYQLHYLNEEQQKSLLEIANKIAVKLSKLIKSIDPN